MSLKVYICLMMASAAVCLGCNGRGDNAGEDASEGITRSGDTIAVSQSSAVLQHLTIETVGCEEYAMEITTTGEVTAIPTQYAEVSAPMPGRVVRCFVSLGQNVAKGSALYEVSSADYSEIVKNHLQAKNEMEQAKRTLARVRDLKENNVASAKELEEAETAYAVALEEYRHSVAVGNEYHIDMNRAEVGQPMVVRSPVKGKVLKNDLVIGEYLKEDDAAKVVVADLAKVWVKANISEKDAPLVGDVERVEVRLVAMADSVVEGKITYIGGMLDPETRTLQTVIECDNRNHQMMPNMYATITLKTKARNSVVIAKEAVLQDEKGRYVLKKCGEDKYVKCHVDVQSAGENRVVVRDGIKEGDEIVVKGGFYLLSK